MASTRSVTRSSGVDVLLTVLSLTGTADVAGAAFGGSSLVGFSPMSGIHWGTEQPARASIRRAGRASRPITRAPDRRAWRAADLEPPATRHARLSTRAWNRASSWRGPGPAWRRRPH